MINLFDKINNRLSRQTMWKTKLGQKRFSDIALISITVLIIGIGASLAYSFFKTPEEASAPITAVSIVPETASSLSDTTVSNSGNVETANAPIFTLLLEDSEARFHVNEVYRGEDKTVVGATNQVVGGFAFDIANPAATQMEPIWINARTLVTDNEFRNRAIKNRILHTDEYEYVTFTPHSFIGLPEGVTIGETYEFQIAGDLSVIGTTRDVTFDVLVTLNSETEMEGFASVTVSCEMFGIVVPASRAVDLVEDEVILEIDFVSVVQG